MQPQLQPLAAPDDDDLFEAAVEEFTRRWRAGERVAVSDYVARYPQIASVLIEVLPTIIAVEHTKASSNPYGPGNGLPSDVPRRLGDFRIVREIGRGGMGIVYEAVQESLGRSVAVKVLPKQMLGDARRVARFEQESRIAARLHHTNIVPVFGVGHDEELHYYVMQFIDGEGWDHRLLHAERRPSAKEAARIGLDAALALRHAHEQGTLHRDVKPANILLDRNDHVWLTDFGLAQLLESDVTATAHVAGTLRYMPPERFQGISDARGDVYSLGVTLFEAVGGRPPFEARTNAELMKKITQEDPPRLRSIEPSVPRDFETIVAKAVAREPKDRYRSAAELADDLTRFIAGSPIRARKFTATERAWRWCKRNRLSAAALAAASASLMLLAVVSAAAYWRASALNEDLNQALVGERNSRETAEETSSTALAALDVVFDRFAPTDASALSGGDGDLQSSLSSAEVARSVSTVSPQIAAALEELLPFYLRLADERGGDLQIRRQAAAAMHRIGLIQAKLGRFDEARTVWTRASTLAADLSAVLPQDVELQTFGAVLECDLGDVERLQDHFSEARDSYRRALAKLARFDREQAPFAARREMARAHLSLAYEDRRPREEQEGRGHPPGGLRRPGHDGPPAGGPPPFDDPFGDPFDTLGLGGPPPGEEPLGLPPPPHELPSKRSRAELQPPAKQDPQERKENLDAAFALLSKLHDERADDRRTSLLLAHCYRERAKPVTPDEIKLESPDFQAAAKLLRELCEKYPTVPDYAFELSSTLSDFHPRGLPKEQRAAATRRLTEALAISERLTGEYPQTTMYAAEQTHILNRLATMQRAARDPQAEATYRRAILLGEKLTKQAPKVFVYTFWLVRLRQGLAEYLAESRRGLEALPIAEAALAEIRPYADADDPPPPAVHVADQLEGMIEHLQRGPPPGMGPPPGARLPPQQ